MFVAEKFAADGAWCTWLSMTSTMWSQLWCRCKYITNDFLSAHKTIKCSIKQQRPLSSILLYSLKTNFKLNPHFLKQWMTKYPTQLTGFSWHLQYSNNIQQISLVISLLTRMDGRSFYQFLIATQYWGIIKLATTITFYSYYTGWTVLASIQVTN